MVKPLRFIRHYINLLVLKSTIYLIKLKQKYYLLLVMVFSFLMVPVVMRYQTLSQADNSIEETSPTEETTINQLLSSLSDTLTGADTIVITCDAKWNGMVRYQTIEGIKTQYLQGKGNRTITITGELQYVIAQGWYSEPDKASYIGLKVIINGDPVYSKTGTGPWSWKAS